MFSNKLNDQEQVDTDLVFSLGAAFNAVNLAKENLKLAPAVRDDLPPVLKLPPPLLIPEHKEDKNILPGAVQPPSPAKGKRKAELELDLKGRSIFARPESAALIPFYRQLASYAKQEASLGDEISIPISRSETHDNLNSLDKLDNLDNSGPSIFQHLAQSNKR